MPWWREERDESEQNQNVGPTFGSVRVLIVGDSGVIFVHDLSQRWTKASLQKWAAEIASTGTFSVPLGSGGPGGLPVPYLVIANKTDITSKEGHGRSGNLVDAARMWVEKQGLLPPSEELPLTDSFPSSLGLIAAAKEARYDKEAVIKFFRKLIQRRYFPDEQPAPSLWSVDSVQSPTHLSGEYLEHDNQLYSSFRGILQPRAAIEILPNQVI